MAACPRESGSSVPCFRIDANRALHGSWRRHRQADRETAALADFVRAVAIEAFPDLLGDGSCREGFLEKARVRAHRPGILGRRGHVARHEKDLDIRPDTDDPLRQDGTAHARHDDVGDQEVDGARVARGNGRRIGGDLRRQHRIAVSFQHLGDDLANSAVVFGQQNGFRPVTVRLPAACRLRRGDRRLRGRPVIVTVVPMPCRLSTVRKPPLLVTMSYTVARPRPVPRPGGLVV